MVRGQKIGFNSCECIQFLNNANFHAFHVWEKTHIKLQWYNIFPSFFSFFWFCNATFSTLVTSSNLRNQAPLLIELNVLQETCRKSLHSPVPLYQAVKQLMVRLTNAGNTMTFLTIIITFNQLQSKPLMCMESPLPHSWAVLQRNSLTFWATPRWDRERQWLHQRLSLAVVRGNATSILACVQVCSDFSCPQCINQCSCPLLAQCLSSMNSHRLPNVCFLWALLSSVCFLCFSLCKSPVQYCFAPLFSHPD